MIEEISYSRQRTYYDPETHGGEVLIVGAGGIGSPAALALTKLGIPHLRIVDFDEVEAQNIPNQMYAVAQLGEQKAEAMARFCGVFNPEAKIEAIDARVEQNGTGVRIRTDEGEVAPRGIVVGALDSMEARQHLWQVVKGQLRVPLYIDGRIGGQQIVVYAINPCDPDEQAFYEETLHSDGESVELPCAERAVIDVGFQIASLITRAVRHHLVDSTHEKVVVVNQATLTVTKGE